LTMRTEEEIPKQCCLTCGKFERPDIPYDGNLRVWGVCGWRGNRIYMVGALTHPQRKLRFWHSRKKLIDACWVLNDKEG